MRIKNRLAALESMMPRPRVFPAFDSAEGQAMMRRVQAKLNLPLPRGTDVVDGLRRLQEAIESKDFESFRAWADEQHAAYNSSD
jgi:hypothetical protein